MVGQSSHRTQAIQKTHFPTSFKAHNGRQVRMPTSQQLAKLGARRIRAFLRVIPYHVWLSLFDNSKVRRKEPPRRVRTRIARLGGLMRESLWLFARGFACGASQTESHENGLDQDPDEFLYMMDSCRDRLNTGSSPESMRVMYSKLCPRSTKLFG